MNIFFSGIGGVGIGPLAEIALDAGYTVQGSDASIGQITKQLSARGISISTDQSGAFLDACNSETPIDWFVYTAALPANHPELLLAAQLGIKTAKRDELLARIIKEKDLQLIAVAGTHGKTTTTGMLIWTLTQLGIPISYSIGTTLSFGPSGKFTPKSRFFIYECDEFDRNFLHFTPFLSLITSIDYDHPDTYPTQEEYNHAFATFLKQSDMEIMWKHDLLRSNTQASEKSWILSDDEVADIQLPGLHNRQNATLVLKALEYLSLGSYELRKNALELFPGTNRRFERLAHNLYSDYGHHPVEIAATLQLAHEISDKVVLVYQPHQNIRQHEIKDQYTNQFELAEAVYWLPTYLSRENPHLSILSPETLTKHVTNRDIVHFADLDDTLWNTIRKLTDDGNLVLLMGAGTIDSWAREQLDTLTIVNIIVRDTNGNFIMQKRDNKPGISNPNMVTAFGGHVETSDQTLRDAALRELTEETNLGVSASDLRYFKTYHKTPSTYGEESYVTYYLTPPQTITDFKVYEGQGFEIINPNNSLTDVLLSPLMRRVILDYNA